MIWAGVEADGLAELAADVVEATAAFGQPPDPRPFHAHITLGRLRRPADVRRHLEAPIAVKGTMDRVVLWESRLGADGPHYEEVASWRLP